MSHTPPLADSSVAAALLEWHPRAGRHDLPWQHPRTPYRVWISEIMLQQTQVATVIPYYQRFLARFPDVRALAKAPIDEVLHLWSGLGYYARARNLHRAAVRILHDHGGQLPVSFEALAALPGIGRSTAGAILALTADARVPILDGNARRVLARYFAVVGARGDSAAEKRLWALAERCMPRVRIADYTQAIMDLGATVCLRRRPLCTRCPIAAGCLAHRTGRQHELPSPRRPRLRRLRHVFMVLALDRGRIRLERRPESGVWGGLWCLPEFDSASAAAAFARDTLGAELGTARPLAELEHAFTHFDLRITPLMFEGAGAATLVREDGGLWYNLRQPARVGLPAPIRALLTGLAGENLFERSP